VRLPFPERVPLAPVCGFATALCLLQLYQGTAPGFSVCCFLFIIIIAKAFNVAGGLTRPSGGYIFFFAVLGVLIGLIWKAVLGEPADSNLAVPMITMEVYVCAACSLLLAAYVSKRFTPEKGLLDSFLPDDKMQSAAVGCMVVGVALAVFFAIVPAPEGGTFLSALNQLNRFLLLAIFLGTIQTIRSSGGSRSINLPVLVSICVFFISGVLIFSKEGIISPFLCLALAAASQRYRVTPAQILVALLWGFFIFQYLVPYSQYGRNFHTDTIVGNIDVAMPMLLDLGHVRDEFERSQAGADEQVAWGYFNTHQGFMDRLQMISPDDGLNALTERGVVPGPFIPLALYFENLLPHFIVPNKVQWGGGNLYAHQMGFLGDDDLGTGISFSPAGEAFHLGRWSGILIVAPVLWIMLFTLFDTLCGDTRKSPWGLLVILIFAHIAPEGGLGIMIYTLGYGAIGILFAALATSYLMPLVGETIRGGQKRIVRLPTSNPIQSSPNRIRSL
jgi:hypothetical protein